MEKINNEKNSDEIQVIFRGDSQTAKKSHKWIGEMSIEEKTEQARKLLKEKESKTTKFGRFLKKAAEIILLSPFMIFWIVLWIGVAVVFIGSIVTGYWLDDIGNFVVTIGIGILLYVMFSNRHN